MGLLDYYRQFEGLSQEEVSAELREHASERRSRELDRQAVVDLSRTTWPRLPAPDVVAAITFAARRGLNSYASADRDALRNRLATAHGVAPARIAVGHGAAQLLESAALELIEPGQSIVCPWPSFGLFATIALRARARLIPARRLDPEAIVAALEPATRIVLIARPNDPTGELLSAEALATLLAELPDRVAVLVDEALIDFADAEPTDAAIGLLEQFPRALVLRSFSKAWGLAGLRCGYAVAGPDGEALIERIEPPLGIGDLNAAGALESLRDTAAVRRRVALVAAERPRLAERLGALGFEVAESQANFVWASHPRIAGTDLAAQLQQRGVLVASGARLAGEPAAIRIQVRERECSERLLAALEQIRPARSS